MTNRKYCVYKHVDLNYKVFYIGSGDYDRPYCSTSRTRQWREKAKLGYKVILICDGLTKEESLKMERSYILKYGKIKTNTGCLVNRINGLKEDRIPTVSKKLIDNFRDRKVINTNTNEVFNSIEEAASTYRIQINTLIRHLEGKVKNKIPLEYYFN